MGVGGIRLSDCGQCVEVTAMGSYHRQYMCSEEKDCPGRARPLAPAPPDITEERLVEVLRGFERIVESTEDHETLADGS